MIRPPQKILAAIPPDERAPVVLDRATALARHFACEVEIIACVHDPALANGAAAPSPQLAGARAALIDARLAAFRELAAPMVAAGLRATVRAIWSYPVYAGLLAEIERYQPDLVVAPAFPHSLADRLGLTDSDWQLIRHCTRPLLLARGAGTPDWHTVLVAVDPLHAHAKPADLDERLLAAAVLFAGCWFGPGDGHGSEKGRDQGDGHVHVLHAYLAGGGVPLQAPGAGVAAAWRGGRNPALEHRAALEALAAGHGLPPARVHFEAGDPREVIPATARQLHAGLVVMGAVSRGLVQRLVAGSTVEAVLDRLDSDILLLHPGAGPFGSRTGAPP